MRELRLTGERCTTERSKKGAGLKDRDNIGGNCSDFVLVNSAIWLCDEDGFEVGLGNDRACYTTCERV